MKSFLRNARVRTKRHVLSCYMSAVFDMNEKVKSDEEADETAAAKETEEISKEDVEIRRLIEERETHPKKRSND